MTEERQANLHGEVSIEELLSDPIVHLLMRYDRINIEDVRAAVRNAASRLNGSLCKDTKAA